MKQQLVRYLFGVIYAPLLLQVTVHAAPDTKSSKQQSSYELMSAENKAMQDDPSLNPAMFWVAEGESLWQAKSGSKNIA